MEDSRKFIIDSEVKNIYPYSRLSLISKRSAIVFTSFAAKYLVGVLIATLILGSVSNGLALRCT